MQVLEPWLLGDRISRGEVLSTLLFRGLSYDLCQRPREIDALEAQPREPWCLRLHTLSPSPSANNRIDSCATRWRKRIGGAIKSPSLFPPEIANEQMSRYAKHRTITCSLIDLSSLPLFSTSIISCFTHSPLCLRCDKSKEERKTGLDVKSARNWSSREKWKRF